MKRAVLAISARGGGLFGRRASGSSGLLDGALDRLEHLWRDLLDAMGFGCMGSYLGEKRLLGVGLERRVTARHDITT